MNKIFRPVMMFVLTCFLSTPLIHAEVYHREGYSSDLYQVTNEVTQEQHFKHFILDLLTTEIMKAAINHYQDETITGIAYDWESNYNVVEIDEPPISGDKRFEYPFKVTVTVHLNNGDLKNPKMYGPDKLTFGIVPGLLNNKNKDQPYTYIKLIKYEHIDSPKNS
ncbi:hypothetical protein [Metabacillus niabensis]|uniref:DUF3888 domain-containing protein n=1 Tax=Metabacillus niabensis TaxID=324854 RepID=A0ABT9Z9G8_9BACI|nr:hypothetical protein [Metabacillus niabensis]MDQ0228243.1 hypothetical protein [Metabacillus niabensis]